MLAELAAANAAFAVIKQAVANGNDLARCASHIGQLVTAKESLQKKVNKKKASHQTTDFEEFMALERIREQEEQLKQIMIYAGRPGLLNDWQQFQREARINRRKAEEARKRKQEQYIEYLIIALAVLTGIAGLLGLLYWMAFLKGVV